jgi:hypothetical protein
MAIDHAGLILFPGVTVFRAIGRLAFPLFAYFIAEGCKYTKNRLKHFLLIFITGSVYLLFYLAVYRTLYASIFLTFSASVLLVYLLDAMKAYMLSSPAFYKPLLCALGFFAVLGAAWILFLHIPFDYGFFGMLAPVAAGMFDVRDKEVPRAISILSAKPFRILWLGICLIPICLENQHGVISFLGIGIPVQYLCLLSLPLLLLYNGKPGTRRLKYFFYLFYPLHLAVLEAIALFI